MKYIKKFQTHSDYTTYKNSQDYLTPNVSYCVDLNEVHFEKYIPAPPETRIVATFNVTDTSSATQIIGRIKGGSAAGLFSEIEIDGIVLDEIVETYQFDTTGEHTVKYTLVDSSSIDDNAFDECSGLTSITIPYSITSISEYAFGGCSGLTSIKVADNNTVYDSRNNCNAIIETATDTLMLGCKNTVIPNDIIIIGYRAFYHTQGITTITIPNSVTTINEGGLLFPDMTSITIPSSVTSIGTYAISIGNQNSQSIDMTFLPTTPPSIIGSHPYIISMPSGVPCTIYVPSESVAAYKSSWSVYSNYIQAIPTT